MRFAVESQFDMIAEQLDMDPLEIRLKNARRPGDILPNEDFVKNFGLVQSLDGVARRTNFVEKYRKAQGERRNGSKIKRGVGIGTCSYFGGSLIYPNSSSVIVKLNDDGGVSLVTGAVDMGQGAETVLSQIVAEEMSVPVEDIQVYAADTETTTVDIGSWISGLTWVTGNAAKKAAENAMKKLLQVAAEELDADSSELEAKNKEIFVKHAPDRKISYKDVIAASIQKKRGDSDHRGRPLPDDEGRADPSEPGDDAWPMDRELLVVCPGSRGGGRHRDGDDEGPEGDNSARLRLPVQPDARGGPD